MFTNAERPLRFFITVGILFAMCLHGCSPSEPGPAGSQVATGDEPDDLQRIIILNNGDSPFWDAARAGLQDADRELKLREAGLTAVFEANDGTPQGQLDKLRQFASQNDIVAVGISATDADNAAIADEMRNLMAAGVKVITVDSDLNRDTSRDARFAFVGTDNYLGGVQLGRCAKAVNPDGNGYVTFVGRTGAQNAIERIGGFAEGAGEGFEQLDNMGDNNDRTRARDNVRNAIRNHPDRLTTLVGIWSYNAPAIVDVVEETETRENMTIVVFDAEPLAIQQMGEGMIDAMVVQNPYQMGYQGVRLLKALVEDDQPVIDEMLPNYGDEDGDLYNTGLKVVVPDEKSPISGDMFDENTQFLRLGEFKEWLNEYGLTGS